MPDQVLDDNSICIGGIQSVDPMNCCLYNKHEFNAPNKLTLESPRGNEARLMDIAMVEVAGVVLVLVYVMREPNVVRAISLRRASKKERTLYAKNNH